MSDHHNETPENCTHDCSTCGENCEHAAESLQQALRPGARVDKVIAGAVTQFWTDVQWENVNYMFVDMPPGTGDVPLTVFQSLPVAGVVVVTSPQELVGMIVDKAVNMADMMHVPVLGIVENMAYYTCPDCGKQHAIFGESHIEAIAAKHGIPNTAKLPIDPAIAAACDAGRIEDVQGDWLSSLADAIEGK